MNDFLPIVAMPTIPEDEGICIVRKDDKVHIAKNMSDIVWRILSKCDGRTSESYIVESFSDDIDTCTVQQIIDDLRTIGVICDSRELFYRFHDESNAPMRYLRTLSKVEIAEWQRSPRCRVNQGLTYDFNLKQSQIATLQYDRHSVRSYTNEPLSLDEVGSVCSVGYCLNGRRAVASGGALYPLKIYAIVSRQSDDLPCGYYEYDPELDTMVKYGELDQEAVNFAFSTSRMLFNAPVTLVIAGDLDRQSRKYANRGYRLTLLEAGQVAQNMVLAAIEYGLGTCELGGVLDVPIKRELAMPGSVAPLVAMTIGHESSADWVDDEMQYSSIASSVVGAGNIVEQVSSVTYGESSFFGAYAAIKDDMVNVACGTSTSEHLAKLKAVVEAYERYVSEHPRIDEVCCARDLQCDWLDPRLIAPLTNKQLVAQQLSRFNEDLSIPWTRGYSIYGGTVMVPADLVYYGFNTCYPRIINSNSSGVAAYTSHEVAVRKAALEMIERDALMRTWLCRITPNVIGSELLSRHLQRRIEFWRSYGRAVNFLLLESQFVPTILVAITSNQYPYFISGASANDNLHSAASKAFEEAEYTLVSKLHSKRRNALERAEVVSPGDHGDFYAAANHNEELSWLFTGPTALMSELQHVSTKVLLTEMNAITVDMSSCEHNSGIHVVRVLSSAMIPIAFGYGCDHFKHNTLSGVDGRNLSLPHFFA